MFAAALSDRRGVRTLMFLVQSSRNIGDCLSPQETRMSQKTPLKNQDPAPIPAPGRSSMPTPSNPPRPPVEPIEVLGRHKNTGQKDHKGAR